MASLFSSFEVLIGLRYLRAKRKQHFVSFISVASVVGIVLGVAVLITVTSVFNGFAKEFRERWLAGMPHVRATSFEGSLSNWQNIQADVAKLAGVAGAAPYVQGQGMLTGGNGGNPRGVAVTGILPDAEAKVTELSTAIKAGALADLKPDEFGIFIGAPLARALQAKRGDKVTLITPTGNVTPIGSSVRWRQFTVVGIFNFGHNELDSNLAFIHMKDAQALYKTGENVSGVRLKLNNADDAPQVRKQVSDLVGKLDSGGSYVTDWTLDNANYFRAVKTEKRMVSLILLLIVAIAAFNLVSSLVMTVTDKQGDIAILRTLGASPGSIMLIFMIQGSIIGMAGTLLGLVLGLLLAHNVGAIIGFYERLVGGQVLSPDLYFITGFPTDVQMSDVLTVIVISIVLAFGATLYPSYRASRINPAEVLRYE